MSEMQSYVDNWHLVSNLRCQSNGILDMTLSPSVSSVILLLSNAADYGVFFVAICIGLLVYTFSQALVCLSFIMFYIAFMYNV